MRIVGHFSRQDLQDELFIEIENCKPNGNWLLIGLGGGVLTMKLLRAFPKVRLMI